ncbi:MAG: CmcJ/NvfI family oxidoreductase [Pseudomonadota bacterium]
MSAVLQLPTHASEPGAVTGRLKFLELSADEPKPNVFMPTPEDPVMRRSNTFSERQIRIHDARELTETPRLDDFGFELHGHPTTVRDFTDDEEVRGVYYPEAEALLRARTGATRVHFFDHTVRIEDAGTRAAGGRREPVHYVHNDYTEKSGPQRLTDLLPPDEAARWQPHRFAIINVWRSIAGPVETTPLAFADARSLEPTDLVATNLVYPDRTGEIYQVKFSDRQRWYYFSRARRDEAILIKVYDSAIDGRARFNAHAAFVNEAANKGAAPRQSIELRALVSFAPG